MGEAARVANQRIDTANRGKKMLDEGGPDVELTLRCKRQCRKTVEDDAKNVRALDQLSRDYDDAISKIKASLTTDALQPEEKYDFEQLVGLYEERKAACERAIWATSVADTCSACRPSASVSAVACSRHGSSSGSHAPLRGLRKRAPSWSRALAVCDESELSRPSSSVPSPPSCERRTSYSGSVEPGGGSGE